MNTPRNDASEFTLTQDQDIAHLALTSPDGMNRLSRAKIVALRQTIEELRELAVAPALIISGNPNFSAGADLHEIARLNGSEALKFAQDGQRLMNVIADYPAPAIATIHGFCMGGGLDLALACHRRIASKHAVFGHRGAALGLITGWGGTQRLPRLIGKARALQMFIEAEKVHAIEALRVGLVDAIAEDPIAEAMRRIQGWVRA